jgi:hypothetical protein
MRTNGATSPQNEKTKKLFDEYLMFDKELDKTKWRKRILMKSATKYVFDTMSPFVYKKLIFCPF